MLLCDQEDFLLWNNRSFLEVYCFPFSFILFLPRLAGEDGQQNSTPIKGCPEMGKSLTLSPL